MIPEKRRAPSGMIWRCTACGKEAEDLYGMIGARSRGWDESCMLNAVPVPAQGTEAQRAETENTGSVHDGPVVADDAPITGKSDQEGA